eukprot:15156041-Heterocapsa_arctica.AAC.1
MTSDEWRAHGWDSRQDHGGRNGWDTSSQINMLTYTACKRRGYATTSPTFLGTATQAGRTG